MSIYDITGGHTRLTANQARGLYSTKEESFRRTLGIIRQLCDEKIKERANAGMSSLTYEVPKAIFGQDTYDHKTMGRSLAVDLHRDGYLISGKSTCLVISWIDPSDSLPASIVVAPPKKPRGGRGRKVELQLNM